jgi:hypothetical protein
MKKIFLYSMIFILCSSCSQFALLTSGGSLVISQSSYVKLYNGVDVLTIMRTGKSIKTQIYDKGKNNVQTLIRLLNH